MRKINTTNAETLAGVHTNNLVKSKRKNIGANLYSCFDICQEVRKFTIANNEKTDNRISSICMPLKRKEQIYDRRTLQCNKVTNSEQGITLLALVVTVVVMLILAAVGIGLIVRR